MKKCKFCKKRMIKVIYAGFPLWLCSDEYCNAIAGPFTFIMFIFPFNGIFYGYTGSYWKALYHWLFDPIEVI